MPREMKGCERPGRNPGNGQDSLPDGYQLVPLPRIAAPKGLTPAGSYIGDEVLVDNVIGAIQQGESTDAIQSHLAYYQNISEEDLRMSMNEEVNDIPAIFYVVETDNPHMIRCWIKYGGDPNAIGPGDCPLLAFAILHGRGKRTLQQATSTVETLLTLGASPAVIPTAFYTPFNRSLPLSGPIDTELSDIVEEAKSWCTPRLRRELVSALNLTQRYRLFQAAQAVPSSRRQKQLVSRMDAELVLGLQYTVIGQDNAVKALKRRLMT